MSQTKEQAAELVRDSFIWDAHAGVFPDPGVDLSLLEDWRTSNVNYLSINVGFDVLDWHRTLTTLAAYRRFVLGNPDRYLLAGGIEDIERAGNEGKLAISFDIEGMNALNGNLDMVDVYHGLGVRQMLFAYNLNNDAAGGCHDYDTGLTDFGRQVVRRMNELGMIVDCSHIGYRTSMDIIEVASGPVVFSHSNPTAIWEHQRNINDEQIKACAETGGVIGINGMGIFLGDNDVSTETMMRHIRHLADLVGTEHIGFGFDYSPPIGIDVGEILRSRPDYWPAGNLYDTPHIDHAGPPMFPEIVTALLDDGFQEDEIRGMLGWNFKRVASQAWQGT